MFAITFAIALHAATPADLAHRPQAPLVRVDEPTLSTQLRDALMSKFRDMNDAHQGIFHDDVTGMVAPYFPKGQSFAETQKVLKAQHFEALHPFKGKPLPDGTRTYVSKMGVMSEMFSDVHVVIDFDFEGSDEQDMKIKAMSAFLQASSM